MIPALIVIRLLDIYGGIDLLSGWLCPVMSWVNLPDELAIVWASTLVINIYAGLVVMATLSTDFTVAQMSVLGGMMLVAHALPLEGAIAKKAGVPWWVSLTQRLSFSLLFGFVLSQFYLLSGTGQEIYQPIFNFEGQDKSWAGWFVVQLKSLGLIYCIIFCLVTLLRLIKLFGLEKLIAFLLKPFLRFLGMKQEAANFALIGITLGLTYGGGLLIAEAKKGVVRYYDVLVAILLLNTLHSLIEDTLLVVMMGADFFPVFFGRIVFAFFMVGLIALGLRLLKKDV